MEDSLSGHDRGEVPATSEDGPELERLRAENEALKVRIQLRLRWRKVLASLLVVLTSLTIVSAAVAVWVHQVVFDTDRFVETVEPVLDDPEFYVLIGDRASSSIREALSLEARFTVALEQLDDFLSDAMLDALEVDDRARDLLERFDRPSLAGLAPPIAAAAEARVDAGVHAFFASDAFVSRFPGLVRQAHAAAVALARDELGDLPNVYVESGEVRLNLIPFFAEALRTIADDVRAVLPDFDLPDVISDRVEEGRTQLEGAIAGSLPPDFGQITLMSESELSGVQATVAQLDRNVWVLVVLAIVFLSLAIAVSPNRRNTALHLGIGVFLAVVVAAVAVRRLEEAVVEEIADARTASLAGDIVADTLSGLRTLELVVAAVAVVIALVAYLAGGPEWYERTKATVRDWTASAGGASRVDEWIAARAGLLRAGGVILAALALFATGLDLIPVIVVALTLIGYLAVVSAADRRTGHKGAIVDEG